MDQNTISEQTVVQQTPMEEQPTDVQKTIVSEGTTNDENLKAATVNSMEYHRQALREKIDSGEQ